MRDAYFNMMVEMPVLPFRMRPLRVLTDDELERFCAQQDALHIEKEPNGELEVRPISGTNAGAVGSDILFALYDWNKRTEAGRVLPNVGYFLADGSMRGPRISWVPESQFLEVKARSGGGFIHGAPPFVVEVLSSQRKAEEWRQRMEMWIKNGVEVAWLVDPSRKAVEIYRPGKLVEVQEGQASVIGEGPVAGFLLDLVRVWGLNSASTSPIGTDD